MSPPPRRPGSPGKSDDDSTSDDTATAGGEGRSGDIARAADAESKAGGGRTPSGAQSTPAKPAAASDAVVGSGEFRSSADRRTGLISGITSFGVKRIRYSNVKGLGIFEGDISLGPIAKLNETKAAADALGLSPTL